MIAATIVTTWSLINLLKAEQDEYENQHKGRNRMPKIVDREEMRNTLLDAAMRVFADKGYHAASMSKVAKEAGVAKGTLYIYFDSKDELTIAIVERHLAEISKQIIKEGQCETLDAFLEELRQTMDVTAEQASFYRVFFEVVGPSFVSAEFRESVAGFFDKVGAHYAGQIAYLQSIKAVANQYDAHAIGRVFASMLDGVVLHKGLFGISQQRHHGMTREAVTLLGMGLQTEPPRLLTL